MKITQDPEQKDKLIRALRQELRRFVSDDTLVVIERVALGDRVLAMCKVCGKALWSAAVSVGGCCSNGCYTKSQAEGGCVAREVRERLK